MNTGFNSEQNPQDDVLKKLMAMLNDTGSGGLKGLLSRLFGGVAPTQESAFGFGSSQTGSGGGIVGPPGGGSGGGGPTPVVGPPGGS